MKTYTTVAGDTWDGIAYLQLGGERHTDELMRYNQQHLSIIRFEAGVALVLPPPAKAGASTLPPWKQVVP